MDSKLYHFTIKETQLFIQLSLNLEKVGQLQYMKDLNQCTQEWEAISLYHLIIHKNQEIF
jgi:hypothetical protein